MDSKNRIPEFIANLPVLVRAAAIQGAQMIAEDAKNRVPYDPDKAPHLRDRIHVEIEGGPSETALLSGRRSREPGIYVVAGDKEAFWGHLVEFGTSHSAAEPFLVPAFEANRDKVVAEIDAAIKAAAR